MITPAKEAALESCYLAAKAAGHIFPAAAACEGALESTWFTSRLYVEDYNIFGTKQHVHPVYATVSIPTKEFIDHVWITVNAPWVKYPNMQAAFKDRMDTLVRMAPSYPHYQRALAATTPEEYLTEVSLSWSTGPQRGPDAISILHAHGAILK